MINSPQRLGDHADFVDRAAAPVAGLPAMFAARAAVELHVQSGTGTPISVEIFPRIVHRLAAIRTDRAHEALRDETL